MPLLVRAVGVQAGNSSRGQNGRVGEWENGRMAEGQAQDGGDEMGRHVVDVVVVVE